MLRSTRHPAPRPRPARGVPAILPAAVLALALALAPPSADAAPDDTLVVRTFTFDSIATRRAVFPFPEDGEWAKILMRYTIKCDEATSWDPYPCGEWDVTTHTRVFRPTGRQDSTRREWPSVLAPEGSPAELGLCRRPTWQRVLRWEGGKPGRVRLDDAYLRLAGTGGVRLPPEALAGLDSVLTICLWARGEPGGEAGNRLLLEAGAGGARVAAVCLPGAAGQLRFEAGGRAEGNTNRVEKTCAPGEATGLWHHWAFVKDARRRGGGTGWMGVYLDGRLWHQAAGMGRTLEGIDAAMLGGAAAGDGLWHRGDVDELAIFAAALDSATIRAWMHRPPGPRHPARDCLRLYWSFAEHGEGLIRDGSGRGAHGHLQGQPQIRRHGWLGAADALPAPGARLAADSLALPPLTVRLREDAGRPERVTRTLEWWPARTDWLDAQGRLLAATPLDPDTLLRTETRVTWSAPFPVVEEIELARFITPYGKGLDLGEDGFTFWLDVSDYAPLLRGDVDLEAHNTQELLDLQFWFIRGRPARRVLVVDPVWPLASHRYDRLAANQALSAVLLPLRPDAAAAAVLSRVSGHGHAGPENCCEWTPKEHAILLDGRTRSRWTLWRDCGLNPMHPQGGTWQFDRAGWCPGTFVSTHRTELAPVQGTADLLVDYGLEAPDPVTGEGEGVFVEGHVLVQYGPPLAEVDVELAAVLAPSAADEQRRLNPPSHSPLVVVRNRGARPLEELTLSYGLEGAVPARHIWRGHLAFLEEDTLCLPAPDWRTWRRAGRFRAELAPPAGLRDERPADNALAVALPPPLVLPGRFLVEVVAPGFGRAAENQWRITDGEGRVVARRERFTDREHARDLVELAPGAYHFLFTDSAEDGLIRHWWLRGSAPDQVGENGSLRILDEQGGELLNLGFDFAEKREAWFFVGTIH